MAIINIGSGSVKLYSESTKQTRAIVTLLEGAEHKDTFDAVAFFCSLARAEGENITIFGTEAMRKNGQALAQQIKDCLGLNVDIIDGKTEAICGFLGAVTENKFGENLKNNANSCKKSNLTTAVIDVGGASSEVAAGTDYPDFCISLKTGATSLYRQFGSLFDDNSAQINSKIKTLNQYLNSVIAPLDPPKADRYVLIGGSALGLGAVLTAQSEFNPSALHNYLVTTSHLPKLIQELLALSPQQRMATHPFLEYNRALILPYGIAALHQILAKLGADSATLSTTGLIEGYIKLMQKQQN